MGTNVAAAPCQKSCQWAGGKPYLPDRDPDPVSGKRYPSDHRPSRGPAGPRASVRDQLWVLGMLCPRALCSRPFGVRSLTPLRSPGIAAHSTA
jgi:hypothetical protein